MIFSKYWKYVVIAIALVVMLLTSAFSVLTQTYPGFDWQSFFSVSVSGIPLLFVVMGLVTLWGKFGATGNIQLISSFATGLVLGVCYQMSSLGFPTDFGGWFAIVIYGLALGLVASLFYDTFKDLLAKVVSQQMTIFRQNN